MKRFSSSSQTLKSLFSALFLAGALALTGCSASTISGPDLAPSDETIEESTRGAGASHNEGEASKDDDGPGGGSTNNPSGAGHNN